MQRSDLAIEFISVLGLAPVEYVRLAASLGCRRIGIGLEPIVAAKSYPKWSMRTDHALRRDTISALAECSVSVSLGEGFIAWPNKDVRDTCADLDAMRELNAQQVNLIALDSDLARTFDQCALFAELAAERGMGATVEFMPGLPIGDLDTAASAARHAGSGRLRVLVDAMHFFRSGSRLSRLTELDPAMIGYVQLCDVPLQSDGLSYADEARYARQPPGQGELPLAEFVAALPADIPMGIEVPMMAQSEAGIGPQERLAPCLEQTWRLINAARAARR